MREYVSVDEAAQFLGFKKSYLYKLVFQKALPYYKPLNGKLLFDRAELEALVRAGRVSSVAELSAKADNILNEAATR